MQQQAKAARKGLATRLHLGEQRTGIHPLQRNAEGLGPGLQHRPGLGKHIGIHQKAAGCAIAAGPKTEAHGLGGRRALIQQRGIGDRQAGELADQGLEIEQRLQAPLGDLGLIGGVGRIPGRVLEHMALQQRRRHGAVVAEPDQAATHLIGTGDLLKFSEGLGLTAALRQARRSHGGLQQDPGGHHLRQKLIEVGRP